MPKEKVFDLCARLSGIFYTQFIKRYLNQKYFNLHTIDKG